MADAVLPSGPALGLSTIRWMTVSITSRGSLESNRRDNVHRFE
ncbi:hypothetical protein ACIG87_28705 [Micromonospora sp. NPDC051925]